MKEKNKTINLRKASVTPKRAKAKVKFPTIRSFTTLPRPYIENGACATFKTRTINAI